VGNKVGIGTTSPDYTLDVQGETGFDKLTTLRILNPSSEYGRSQLHLVGRYEGNNDAFAATNARNAIMFKSQSGLDSAITNRWTIQSFPNGTNNDLGFMADTNNTPKVMFRGSNGHVGIGTDSPTSNLHVVGDVAISSNLAVDTNTLFVDSVGNNVGIGTTTPGYKLHIEQGYGVNDNGIFISNSNYGSMQGVNISMINTGAYNYSSYASIKTYSSGVAGATNLALCPTGGNVGIGTVGPGSTLDVHGTGIHIKGTVLRELSAIGTVSSGTYVKLCDFSDLPATTNGVCAIQIRWGGGLGSGTYYYWQGHATGIVGYNTRNDGAGTFNASGVEPLILNQHYHYRTVGALGFQTDSDATGGSYGHQSIYMAPSATITSMSFEVIAMPLRR